MQKEELMSYRDFKSTVIRNQRASAKTFRVFEYKVTKARLIQRQAM